MIHCPVCNMPLDAAICPECGYDPARDYETYPTLGPLSGRFESLNTRRQHHTANAPLRCPECGGTAFTLQVPDDTRRCRSCGWSADRSSQLRCGCGSRYFTIRLRDGAHICPLCGQALSLKELMEQLDAPVQAAPVPAPANLAPPGTQKPVQGAYL